MSHKSALYWVFTFAITLFFSNLSCNKSSSSSQRGNATDSGDNGNTDENSGVDTISIGEEMVHHVESALVEGGLEATQAQAVSAAAISTGVLVIDASSALQLTDTDETQLTQLAPKVTGAFIASVDAKTAGLDEASRLKAIGIIVEAASSFVGQQPNFSAADRSALLGNMAASAVASTGEAGLSAEGAIASIGKVADKAIRGLKDAGINSSGFEDAARQVAAGISGGLGNSGIPDGSLGDALAAAAESASGALGNLDMADAMNVVSTTTEGFVSGIVTSKQISKDVRFALASRVPEGMTAAFPSWIKPEDMPNALGSTTEASLNTFIKKSKGATQAQLAQYIPEMAGGAVKGLSKAAASGADVSANGLASAPFQSMLNVLGGVNGQSFNAEARIKLASDTLSMSIKGLGNAPTYVNAVASNLVTTAFAAATTNRQTLGFKTTSDNSVQTLYTGLFNGAFSGLAGLANQSSANKTTVAGVLPNLVSNAMSSAVTTMSGMYTNNTPISTNALVNIPALAMQSMGERLSSTLPPADLNIGFASATAQYLHASQGEMAAKNPTTDFSAISKQISGQALASFSGSWNANPAEIQSAATALNGSMGNYKNSFDSKVIAAVQGASAALVTTAVVTRNGSMPGCSTDIADSLSDGDFEAKMRQHPEFVSCQKATSCPKARTTKLATYLWQPDMFNEKCFLYTEPKVTVSSTTSTSCPSNSSFVYGIGCRPNTTTCAEGFAFVYGIGCQEKAFFCPAGQSFSAGTGCQTDTVSYNCAANQRWVVGTGCQTSTVQNCALGYVYSATNGCVAISTTPVCPSGFHYTAVNGCVADVATAASTACAAGFFFESTSKQCRPLGGSCAVGTYWDQNSLTCKSSNNCPANYSWDLATNACKIIQTATTCSAGYFWNAATLACVAEGQCNVGYYWDSAAHSCRANGSCTAGMIWNPEMNACSPDVAVTCASCNGVPPIPSPIMITSGFENLKLNWTGVSASEYLLVRRINEGITDTPATGVSLYSGDSFGGGQVIYRGPYTSYTDSAITASTTYYYSVYALNQGTGGPFYSNAASTSGRSQVNTGAGSAPAAPGTLSIASAVGSLNLSWTPVAAAGYVLIRRPTTPVSIGPSNTITYTTGQNLDSGKIIYSGTDTSFTDLSATFGTTYHYAVFAYNGGVGGPFYSGSVTASGSPQDSSVDVVPPVPTGLTAAGVPEGINVSWTATSAVGYLTVRKIGGAPSFVPDPHANYLINSYQNADTYVVQKGSTTFFFDRDLTPGQVYHYAVFAYNNGQNGLVYSIAATSSAAPTAASATPPSAPTNLDLTPWSTKIDLSWSGPAVNYLVLRKINAPVNAVPTTQNYAVNNVINDCLVVYVGSSVNVSDTLGVAPGNTYHYKVYSFTMNGGSPLYSTTTLIGSVNINAVAGTTEWSKQDAAAATSSFNHVAVRSNGEVYVAGSKKSGSDYKWLIQRYNSSGGLISRWENVSRSGSRTGGKNAANSVVFDSSGNAYAGGYVTNNTTGKDWSLAKFNNLDASISWQGDMDGGGNADDELLALEMSADNSALYAVGYVTTSGSQTRAKIARYNLNNNNVYELWPFLDDSDNNPSSNDRAVAVRAIGSSSNGFLYVLSNSIVNSVPVANVKKFNQSSGAVVATWNISLPPGIEAHDMAFGSDGSELYVVGKGTGNPSMMIVKKFSESSPTEVMSGWAKSFSSPGNLPASAESVVVDNNYHVYIAGWGTNLVDGSSGKDIWIKRYSPNGTEITGWEKKYDPASKDSQAKSIFFDSSGSGSIYIGGQGGFDNSHPDKELFQLDKWAR